MTQGIIPKFSKQYATVGTVVESCVKSYCNETEQSVFPAKEHTYEIDETVSAEIKAAIGKIAD